jgi:hypothetical protein
LDEAVSDANEAAAVAVAAEDEKKVIKRRVINKATGEVTARPVPAAATAAAAAAATTTGAAAGRINDPLDKSLSSAFFQNLRKSGSDTLDNQVTTVRYLLCFISLFCNL